jgi:hypothetical protein
MTIYIVIAVVKWEEPGYTSICGLQLHCKMQELSWQKQSIPEGEKRAQNFVAGRCLMVQNTENDPDRALGCSRDLKIQANYLIRPHCIKPNLKKGPKWTKRSRFGLGPCHCMH